MNDQQINPEELQKLHNAMLTTAEVLADLTPGRHALRPFAHVRRGYGMSSYGAENLERMIEPVRERIITALKERLVDDLRERAGDVVRERLRETLPERIADGVRSQVLLIGPSIGIGGAHLERLTNMLIDRLGDTLRERLEHKLHERVGEAIRTRAAELFHERVGEVVRTVLTRAQPMQGDFAAFAPFLAGHLSETLRLKLSDAIRERVADIVRERVGDAVREVISEVVRTHVTEVLAQAGISQGAERLVEGIRRHLSDALPEVLRERMADGLRERFDAVVRERARDTLHEVIRGVLLAGAMSGGGYGDSQRQWGATEQHGYAGAGIPERLAELVRQQVQEAIRGAFAQGPMGTSFGQAGFGSPRPFMNRQ